MALNASVRHWKVNVLLQTAAGTSLVLAVKHHVFTEHQQNSEDDCASQ